MRRGCNLAKIPSVVLLGVGGGGGNYGHFLELPNAICRNLQDRHIDLTLLNWTHLCLLLTWADNSRPEANLFIHIHIHL